MFNQQLIQGLVDGLVNFATDLLMPIMMFAFIGAITMRMLVWLTVKREDWFGQEFSKRVRRYLELRDDKAEQSFYIVVKRLLEVTYYEVFEVRAILKRRNPDAIMTMVDRVFLVQQGCARLVGDTLRHIRYLKIQNERPKLLEISGNVFRNNPCFNRVFGVFSVSAFNDLLNLFPGLFIVGGIFGTFLGIMKALPELGGMNLSDVEGSKLIMDNFLLKISFSMSTSIIGIVLSVVMTFFNSIFSCEKVYMGTVERFESDLDNLWNLSTSNVLPQDYKTFEENRDPIEALAEELIAKELAVEVGFVNIKRPLNKWWKKVGNQATSKKDEMQAEEAESVQKSDSEAA